MGPFKNHVTPKLTIFNYPSFRRYLTFEWPLYIPLAGTCLHHLMLAATLIGIITQS